MNFRAGQIFHSLGLRLMAPLFVTVGALLGGYGLLSFHSTREHFLALTRAEVQRISSLIQRATHDGMLLNHLDEVQTTIERLAAAPDLASIRVYDKQGNIVLSAHRGDIGSQIGLEAEPCLSCHSAGAPLSPARLERIRLPSPGAADEVLRHLTVIDNEPSCAAVGCHASPAVEKVLGVLDVEMSMAPIELALASARRQLVWTTLILVVLGGAVAAWFIRRLVQRPVRELYVGTQRIAGGDLATRIEVHGKHELARLAEAFNRMADDLRGAHQELQAWSRNLEVKVREKTEELQRAQREVLHMDRMASLGKLAATVAHELNNPLAGVLNYARLVEREIREQPAMAASRDELERYLGLIQKECCRCGGIVRNLLLFARPRGAEMAWTDLNQVVEHSLMLVDHHLEMHGIRLTTRRLAGDSRLLADEAQLQQAFVALFVNAIEAMTTSGRAERELAVELAGAAEQVRIDVRDTGSGIGPELLPRIFEPFFSTKHGASGVGLGLAVVYGIVQRHGGEIRVDSAVGRGTTFHLTLPRRPPAGPAES